MSEVTLDTTKLRSGETVDIPLLPCRGCGGTHYRADHGCPPRVLCASCGRLPPSNNQAERLETGDRSGRAWRGGIVFFVGPDHNQLTGADHAAARAYPGNWPTPEDHRAWRIILPVLERELGEGHATALDGYAMDMQRELGCSWHQAVNTLLPLWRRYAAARQELVSRSV